MNERKCPFLDWWKHLWLLSSRGWLLKTSHLVDLRSGYVAIVQSYSLEPLYTLSVGVWLNKHLDYQSVILHFEVQIPDSCTHTGMPEDDLPRLGLGLHINHVTFIHTSSLTLLSSVNGQGRGRSAKVGFGIAVYKTKLSVVFLRRTRPAWGWAGRSCPAAGWTCGRATQRTRPSCRRRRNPRRGRLQPALDRLVGRRHQGLVRRLGDPHGLVVAHCVRRHEGVLVGERRQAGQQIVWVSVDRSRTVATHPCPWFRVGWKVIASV